MPRFESDTAIGGQESRFPKTRWSAILALRSEASAERQLGFDSIARLYWKPVYKYLRIKWRKSNEDAKDLTQAFFTRALEKDFLASYDPAKARFRTFLRTCLDAFVANQNKASETQKRGGDFTFVSFDFHQAEAELKFSAPSPEECFEKEWLRSLFSIALSEFKQRCEESEHQTHFLLFEKYDIDRDSNSALSYAELASEFGLAVTVVTNYLAYARREFRKLILQKLREVSGNAEEFRNEARRLFGANVK